MVVTSRVPIQYSREASDARHDMLKGSKGCEKNACTLPRRSRGRSSKAVGRRALQQRVGEHEERAASTRAMTNKVPTADALSVQSEKQAAAEGLRLGALWAVASGLAAVASAPSVAPAGLCRASFRQFRRQCPFSAGIHCKFPSHFCCCGRWQGLKFPRFPTTRCRRCKLAGAGLFARVACSTWLPTGIPTAPHSLSKSSPSP